MSGSLPDYLLVPAAGQPHGKGSEADPVERLAASVAAHEGADLIPPCEALVDDLRRAAGVDGGGLPEGVLLHAVLVGLARGASRAAFLHATTRQIQGRPLIEHELSAARLAAIALAEATCDVQLGRLAEEARRDDHDPVQAAEAEIRRASSVAIVEAAGVHGGRGYVGDGGARWRVEAWIAIAARAAPTGVGTTSP